MDFLNFRPKVSAPPSFGRNDTLMTHLLALLVMVLWLAPASADDSSTSPNTSTSISISPRDQVVAYGESVTPTITVNSGDEKAERYFVYVIDNKNDLSNVITYINNNISTTTPENSRNLHSYTPSSTKSSFTIGKIAFKEEGTNRVNFEISGGDSNNHPNIDASVKNEDGYFPVTVRAIAVTKNSDGTYTAQGEEDEVTYLFEPHLYAVNLVAGDCTKSEEEVPDGMDYNFFGINGVSAVVTVGDLASTTPEASTSAKTNNSHMLASGSRTSQGTISKDSPLGGQDVYYSVYDGSRKEWGPAMKVLEGDGQNFIIVQDFVSDPGSDDNKIKVWIDGQPKANAYASCIAKYDITYSTSEARYSDAISQYYSKLYNNGNARTDVRLFVKKGNLEKVFVKAGIAKEYGDDGLTPKSFTEITPDTGDEITKTETINGEEWFVVNFNYYGDIYCRISSSNINSTQEINGKDQVLQLGDNFFEANNSGDFEATDAPEGYVSDVDANSYPSYLGDKTRFINLDGLYTIEGDQDVPKVKYDENADMIPAWTTLFNGYETSEENTADEPDAIKGKSGKTATIKVSDEYAPTADHKVTVQMLVEPAATVAEGSEVKTTLKVNDMSEDLTFDSDTKSNVTEDGRVDVHSDGCNESGTWRKIEVTAKGNGAAPTITVTATGGDILISDISMFEDANTAGHIWTKAPTDKETSFVDLSKRCNSDKCSGTSANAFSFFGRGDNSNAIVFVNSKTVLGGAKNGTQILNYEWNEAEQRDVYTYSTEGDDTGAPFNVAYTSDDGKTYTIDHLKLTDTDGSQWENKHTFGFTLDATVNAKKVSYDREFTPKKRQTICLPFALTATDIANMGLTHVYEFAGVTVGEKLNTVNWKDVTSTGTKAGVPYIVEAGQKSNAIEDLDLYTTELAGKVNDQTMTDGTAFKGVYSYTLLPQNPVGKPAEYWVYESGSGRFKPCAFSSKSYSTDLKPFRGYFDFPQGVNAKLMTFSIFEDGTTTDIDPTVFMEGDTTAPIYNISGQLVSKDGNRHGLPKGIYIQNNQKFVVR